MEKIIKEIPNKPGIYKFLDENREVIYIGKAKELRKRVQSYFRNTKKAPIKTRKLVENTTDIEYTVVDTELEALILETNLIKELRPKYNILMKDDKNYTYIKITTQEDYPRIYITRKMKKDGATYFGPKTSSYDIKKTMKILSSILPYKQCRLNVEVIKSGKSRKKNTYPCLFYQMDRGHSPCITELSPEEYKKIINKVIDFLKGKYTEIIKKIREQMQKAAANKEFERAALLRDRLKSLEKITEKQKISAPKREDIDVIDIVPNQGKYFAVLFEIREGKLINQENFVLDNKAEQAIEEVFSAFLKQYYSDAGQVPKQILIPEVLEDKNEIEEFLGELKGQKVKIKIPKIGRKNKLLKLANKNAFSYAKQMGVKWLAEKTRDPKLAIEKLKTILKLKKAPYRIECYDISHLSGTFTVGSMVVFEGGKPKKSHYRSFNIKQLAKGQINDFEALHEVLKRRLKYLAEIPKDLKLRKKGDCYRLLKEKEELIKVEFETEDKTTEITNLKILDSQYQSLIPVVLKNIFSKIKSRVYHIKEDRPEIITKLLNTGFIEIEHDKFTHGYYPQKQVIDKSFKSKPDLIVIDGGKGQLTQGVKSKKELGIDIPMIGITKRFEDIYLEDGTKISLPNNSPQRHLIQRLRDEAHRFAITKNRKKRIKDMINK